MMKLKPFSYSALLFCLLMSGCALNQAPTHEAFSNIPEKASLNKQAELTAPKRTLKPGDHLQVLYMYDIEKDTKETYRLDNLDEIGINIRDREDLTGAYSIVPNGWLSLPLLEPIFAKGMTIDELRSIITKKYSEILDAPQTYVYMKRWNVTAQTFISTFAQTNRLGPLYETLVQKDGTVTLPMIGTINVHGITLQELYARLRERYKQTLPALDFTITLPDNNADLVTVLGEVKSPGAFRVSSASISLAEALGLASGWTTEATITDIYVIQEKNDQLYVSKFDFKNEFLLASQMRLSAGDMVFVPRSIPTDINVLVDQLIRRNIPVNLNFTKTIN
jgi:polysaccharide export outer membrane protein